MGWDNNTSRSSLMPNVYKKMNKKLCYWVLRQILFTSSAALQQQHLARTKLNVIMSKKSKQEMRSRPTRRMKTLDIYEDFEVVLFRTAYSKHRLDFLICLDKFKIA